jgi:hypothetical protein
MDEADPLAYVIHYRHTSTCSRILSAKPGKEVEIFVLLDQDTKAKPRVAKGMLSNDRKRFSVVVTRAEGEQQAPPYDYNYKTLLEAISVQWSPD